MNRIDRITQILNELERIWKEHPSLRFFQLMNLFTPTATLPPELFYKEDKELYEQLRNTYDL